MEGKTVILSVLIMSLLMVQNQVEAKICCPSKTAALIFMKCLAGVSPLHNCLVINHCQNRWMRCPQTLPIEVPEKTGDTVNEYCQLGCASSVCGALTTLQDSDATEIVNEAVAQCTNACSSFCTKDSANAVVTA
ncbi:unnamed protein product [Eruca vesicaria subsp. sativa]|uniref:Thionin n=1 Tax=Eruca vesicaria subsp. sativa TaxID=29727 RepID=A0ABC8K171_ERUVS|nr:unnamed protein product [Eruca vesicaria subsp. sativa]